MQEQWLPVVGYEGSYEVSDFGRIRSVERRVNTKGGATRLVRQRIRAHAFLNDYPAVNLSLNNKTRMRTIHTMVLEAFIGPRPSSSHDACHGDGSTINNHLSNLRWGTKKENSDDAIRHGTKCRGEKMHSSKLSDEIVKQILDSTHLTNMELAKKFSVHRSTVLRVRNRRTWAHI